MKNHQPNNPLHGVTLEMILTHLVDRYGWEELGRTINIKCFPHEPGIRSSLKFLYYRIPTGFIQHLLNLAPTSSGRAKPLGQRQGEKFVFAKPGVNKLKRL